MRAFNRWEGIVAPLDRANIDTDSIIPKQFMKSIRRSGFGANLFDAWRYMDQGEPGQDCSGRPVNPSFVLNQAAYLESTILLARENFGCGSSREHAPWALRDFGIRALIAPTFADIFYGNCLKNGLLPVELDEAIVDSLFQEALAAPGIRFAIDLQTQTVGTPTGKLYSFEIDAYWKSYLLRGLDEIAQTLQFINDIRAYENVRRLNEPWLFPRVALPTAPSRN